MNKLFIYDLEIQGKDISHTNTIHCLIPYKSKGIVTKEQINGYEQVVKQVLRYVVQRIGKKGIFHEFTVGKLHITNTINDLKKNTKQYKSLNSFTIDKNNTRITIENDGTWCFTPILTKAIKSYFEDYITFLQNILTMQTNGIVIHNSNIRRKTSEYEDALLNVCIKGEELIDNACKAEINLIQWKMWQNMNCTKFVQFFCKLIKKNYTVFDSL